MKVKYLGHASFLITSDSGVKIITDPYTPGSALTYGDIKEAADIVTISHGHGDHNNAATVRGNPKLVNQAGITEAKGIKFKGMATYHDEEKGKARGNNIIFCFEVDGMKVCHMGDLGHPLTAQQAAEMGQIDILFMPVGGYYTIDTKVASQIASQLAPKVLIPMHFKTNKCGYPINGVDDFLKGKKTVTRLDTSETEFKASKLPTATQIMVLQPAL